MTRSLILISFVALIACKKAPPDEVLATPVIETGAAVAPKAPSPAPVTLPSDRGEAITQMVENFSRVHFALDSSTLDEDALTALRANAAIMAAFPRLAVEIQGHADERGTTEYNLALGERRATSVKRVFTEMGVEDSRLSVVSYGEEAPLDRAAGEDAWSKNRRAEFRVLVSDGPAQGTTK